MSTTIIGLDLAKNVFQVHGVDAKGKTVLRRRLRRSELAPFFAALTPCIIGIEACGSGHHWARELQRFGHQVRLIPPQYVRPYVKTSKHDAADAVDQRIPSRPAVTDRVRGRIHDRKRPTRHIANTPARRGPFSNRSSFVKTVYIARPGHGSLRGQRALPQQLVRSGR